jgi:tripartite-type tricarboxylate transporter receptor subunit TctC
MPLPRRRFLELVAGAGALAARTRIVKAQAYPTRPVRIIVGFGPAASGDVAARVLAQALTRLLGQQFIVENRSGAGSTIATGFVAHAPNDGYTLLQGTVANTINAVITPNLGLTSTPRTLRRSRSLPRCRTFWSCIPRSACAQSGTNSSSSRAKPGELSCGSAGLGGTSHFTGELFNVMAGTKLVHVP